MIKDLYQKQWRFLTESFKSGRLAHSYLLAGARELNKEAIALEFAKYINCLNSSEEFSCQQCLPCQQIREERFIDLKIVKEDLSVKQMKEIKNNLIYPPYQSSFRVIIINKADQIREDAASVLLKTLEEPQKGNVFFLLADNYFQVLPTIRSRCQILKFNPLAQKRKKTLEKRKLIYADFWQNLSQKSLIEKFGFVKNLPEREYLIFLEEGIEIFREFIYQEKKDPYSLRETAVILKNLKKVYFLLQKTNINPRLSLENLLLNT